MKRNLKKDRTFKKLEKTFKYKIFRSFSISQMAKFNHFHFVVALGFFWRALKPACTFNFGGLDGVAFITACPLIEDETHLGNIWDHVKQRDK